MSETSLEIIYRDACDHLQQGQWAKASLLLKDIWDKLPQFHPAGFKLGIAQMSLSQWQAAIVIFQKLIEQGHRDPEIICNLAIAYWKNKQLRQALIFFRYNLRHAPYHPETHLNLANLYCSYQHFKSAILHYQTLVNLYPDNLEYRFNLAASFQQYQLYDDAMLHYRYILTKTPVHLASMYNLACIYWQLRDFNAARHFCLETLKYRYYPELEFMRKRIDKQPHTANEYSAYVNSLFEKYATYYNTHMQDHLAYKLPKHLASVLEKLNLHFKQVLDLGCGTGLAGLILKQYTKNLLGLDISDAMLLEADKTGHYQELIHADALHFLRQSHLKFNLIVALELFPYIEHPEHLFTAIHNALEAHGYFIFSYEIGNNQLQDNGRMACSREQINSYLIKAELNIIDEGFIKARLHKDSWLDACFLIIQKGNSK